jgi:glycopeptide antibiotics resistance protein
MFGSWTYLIGLYRYFYTDNHNNLFTIFLLGVSFGIFIEVLQYILPLQRSAEFFDIAFDSLGCLAAVLALKKTFTVVQPT